MKKAIVGETSLLIVLWVVIAVLCFLSGCCKKEPNPIIYPPVEYVDTTHD